MKDLFVKRKHNKPLIFSNDTKAKALKENKQKLKILISENEDYNVQIKLIKDCLNNFKRYLSEIGQFSKSNQYNTSRNFNDKVLKLIQNDNEQIKNLLNYIGNNINTLENQFREFVVKIEERNSEQHENIIKEDYVFYLKNLYMSKESEIVYLQTIINSYLAFTSDTINAEYYDIEDSIIQNSMDNGLAGLRNDIARYTRMLNLEARKIGINSTKIEVIVKLIQEISKEIDIIKNPNKLELVKESISNEKNEKNESNVTPSCSTPQMTKSSTPNQKPIKPPKEKRNSKNNRIETIKQIQNELQQNYSLIGKLENEIEITINENECLQEDMNNLNSLLADKFNDIYMLEMQIDKEKLKLDKK